MHISTFFRALDIVSSCTYSTPLAFSSKLKLSAFVSRSFPLYRPYLRRLISSGQHLGHIREQPQSSLKPTKDYFANISSFPSLQTKSWQIWLLLLLCLQIATVVKWEKEMKDFWLQNQAFIYHFLMGKIHKILALENYSQCHIWILTLSTNFCHIKTDLSGKTVWPQASGFQKLAKMDHFGHFLSPL